MDTEMAIHIENNRMLKQLIIAFANGSFPQTPDSVLPQNQNEVAYRFAEDKKGIFVLWCWAMYKDGIFAKINTESNKEEQVTNFKKMMIWYGERIGVDFSDVDQLMQNVLEQEDCINHFYNALSVVSERIVTKRKNREAKNQANCKKNI